MSRISEKIEYLIALTNTPVEHRSRALRNAIALFDRHGEAALDRLIASHEDMRRRRRMPLFRDKYLSRTDRAKATWRWMVRRVKRLFS